MKKVLQLFLLVLTVSLVSVSCKKDDDTPSNDVNGGKYETISMAASSGNFNYDNVDKIKTAGKYFQIHFKEDNTFWMQHLSDGWEPGGTWKQEGNNITIMDNLEFKDEVVVDEGVVKTSIESLGETIEVHLTRL